MVNIKEDDGNADERIAPQIIVGEEGLLRGFAAAGWVDPDIRELLRCSGYTACQRCFLRYNIL